MKKHSAALLFSVCFILAFFTGCSSAAASSADNNNGSESGTEVTQPEQENKDSKDETEDPDESTDAPDASDNKNGSDLTPGAADQPMEQTTEGFVLSVENDIIYVDLENPGSRTYPGEGEDRKVAFDISGAEQIQTNVSEFNPERKNIIRSGINVSIEYYTENGKNIATKVSTNGDELEPAPSFYE